MAMESQAEALGQLTSDDLEGKVVIIFYYMLCMEMNELKGGEPDLFYFHFFLGNINVQIMENEIF